MRRSAIIDYFKDYPDCCHHPKEDMIVEKLKVRDPVTAATISDLEAKHQEGAKRLRRVDQAVQRVLSDQGLLRQNVYNIIRDFIDHERQHMTMEERVVFPAVLNALQPQDWADVALKWPTAPTPSISRVLERKFSRLHRNILKREEEAEVERAG